MDIKKIMVCFIAVLFFFSFGTVNADDSDFLINDDGKLIKYLGTGGDVIIPDDVIEIGSNVFNSNTDITSVVIPDSVEIIGDNAFLWCWNLESVTFGRGIKSIGSYAFACYFSGSLSGGGIITSIDLKNTSLEYIGSYAFYGQHEYDTIELPDTVTTVGAHAFDPCGTGGLTNLKLSSNMSEINNYCFCNQLLAEIVLPEGIKYIGVGAFESNQISGHLIIPDSVITISSNAFENNNITTVSLSNSLSSIGDSAFYQNDIEVLEVPENVEIIGQSAFEDNQIKTVTLNNGLTKICQNAFANNMIQLLSIPGSVSSIENGAFYNNQISTLKLENGLVSLGTISENSYDTYASYNRSRGAFSCNQITSVSLPSSIETIGDYSFYDNPIESLILPEEKQLYIGTGAFAECKLNAISLPDNLVVMREYAFTNNNISSLTLPNNLEVIREGTFSNNKLVLVNLPESLVTIEKKAFRNNQISNITIPSSVNIIGNYAFDGNIITSIDLPYTITSLEMYSFSSKSADKQPFYWVYENSYSHNWCEENGYEYDFLSTIPENISFTNKTFTYITSIEKEPFSYSFSYDDLWFFDDSTTYNHELAKTSLKAAMATMADDATLADNSHIIDFMSKCGFYRIVSVYPNRTDNSIGDDTIGYSIGSKIIQHDGDYITLIGVFIRSGGYGQEWAGNFNVGTSNNHEGFHTAAETVWSALYKYISDNERYFKGNVKIWTAGYSRGAATANMLAAILDNGTTAIHVEKDNIFAYCFECPQNVYPNKSLDPHDEKYNNIFSIVNPIDLVTKVAPSTIGWNYTRYGITYYIPSFSVVFDNDWTLYNNMIRAYADLLPERSGVDNAEFARKLANERIGQSFLLDILIDQIALSASDRYKYSSSYQPALQALVRGTLGKGDFYIKNTINKNASDMLMDAVSIFGKTAFLMPLYLVEGKCLIDANDMEDQYPTVLRAHYPELCLSWMESLNGESKNDTTIFTDYSYRKIFINCPVNVNVYDNENNLVASINHDEVIDIKNSNIFTYIDVDDQKVIILPNDGQYSLVMDAFDDGNVTYTVTEYNGDSRVFEKVVSYFDVSVSQGDKLLGWVDELASEPAYELEKNNVPLTPDVNNKKDDIVNYNIDIIIEGDGEVSGGGHYISGEYAKLIADTENYKFIGWYDRQDNLLSTDGEYRYLVKGASTSTIRIYAKFVNYIVDRIYGNNRYETSLKIADQLKEILKIDQFTTVVVTTGDNFPDALAGSYLANRKNAPILLINEKRKNKTIQYINDNLKSGGTVYILGGENAVPKEWLNDLTDYNLIRIAGNNRYQTNLEILKEARPNGGYVYDGDSFIVCTGKNYADSLSASALGRQILLVGDKLNNSQKEYLEMAEQSYSYSGLTFYILGGENAVSSEVEEQLKEYGRLYRFSGTDRYETSIMVAETFYGSYRDFKNGMYGFALAYGKNFPDGLCAGPLAYQAGIPLILSVSGNKAKYAADYYDTLRYQSYWHDYFDAIEGFVLGGPTLIDNDSIMDIFRISADLIREK